MTKDQKLKLFSKVREENGSYKLTSNQKKSILTVKDLKLLLEEVKDENMPIVLESYEDEGTCTSSPLFCAEICSETSRSGGVDFLALLTITKPQSYDDWKDEEVGSWSDDILG